MTDLQFQHRNHLRLLVADPKGGDPKPKVAVDTTAWDAVTLPTLVHHDGGRL